MFVWITCREGTLVLPFLTDVMRWIEWIEEHIRDHLANIEHIRVFVDPKTTTALAEVQCSTDVDEYARFPPLVVPTSEGRCVLAFDVE